MKFVLVKVMFGTWVIRSGPPATCDRVRSSCVNADIAIGTSWMFSSRFCAVTISAWTVPCQRRPPRRFRTGGRRPSRSGRCRRRGGRSGRCRRSSWASASLRVGRRRGRRAVIFASARAGVKRIACWLWTPNSCSAVASDCGAMLMRASSCANARAGAHSSAGHRRAAQQTRVSTWLRLRHCLRSPCFSGAFTPPL